MVSNIVAPIEALSNQNIEITWSVTNQGTSPASGTWNDYVFLSTDNQFGGDQFYGSFEFQGSIAPGETIVRTQTIALPRVISGDHYVIVQTDALNSLFEHNGDGNNITVDDTPISISL